jgi:hypothetical protein
MKLSCGLTALLAFVAGALFSSSDARADTFTTGEIISYTQGDWSLDAPASALLQADFGNVYASNGFTLDVGTGFSISFGNATAVQAYLPTPGLAAALTSDQLDPTTTVSGVFGGDATALALDVNFSDFGVLHGTSSTPFGDLLLTGFTGSFSGLNGMSVRDLLALAEAELGGSSTLYDLEDLDSVAAQVTGGFEDGVVTQFATDHIELPPSISETPLPAALPLFASGLGAMGLFGWRRKRKNSAALAAA